MRIANVIESSRHENATASGLRRIQSYHSPPAARSGDQALGRATIATVPSRNRGFHLTVFLLTRVREEYDKHGDNARAVADGLAATGRVITAAAPIMVCVFGSFVLGDLRDLKLFGFGLAFAVFIDATVVRLVLVPSAMELMGNANWWAPSWLVRYLPTIRVEGGEDHLPAVGPAGGGG